QWFYLGVPLIEQIPSGINFVVGTYVIVELAEVGNEGVMYGLLTTVSNLPGTFGTMIMNILDGQLSYTADNIPDDTPEIRNGVAYSYLISYAFIITGCFWVLLLPPQKEQVAELKKNGGRQPHVAASIFYTLFVIMCVSITSNLMTMFESTKCAILAGGDGCPDDMPKGYLAGIFVPSGIVGLAILYKVFIAK
ncbi:folate-Biopterin Transporter (FBT) family, partial [Thraustotheca clavata]